jgi:hypothetical protein
VVHFAGWEAILSPQTVLAAVASSVGIGLLFGTIPVRKASLASPVTSLRGMTRNHRRAFFIPKWMTMASASLFQRIYNNERAARPSFLLLIRTAAYFNRLPGFGRVLPGDRLHVCVYG